MTTYLFEVPNVSTGVDNAFTGLVDTVPVLPPMLLFFVFFMVFLGGTANQKRRKGYADYPFWATMSSLTILMLSLLMTVGAGSVDITTLTIVVSLTVLSGVWFFLSSVRGEV